ncbi:hypothetical protein K2P97_00370 [bacterium]|nr:hypothetical protein [bacterium]
MTDTQIEKSIDEATSRCAGIIIRTIKNIYGEDEDFNLIRRSVLAALGNQGLSTELKFIFIAASQNLSLQAQIKKEHEL